MGLVAFSSVGLCLSESQSGVPGPMDCNGVGLDFVTVAFPALFRHRCVVFLPSLLLLSHVNTNASQLLYRQEGIIPLPCFWKQFHSANCDFL